MGKNVPFQIQAEIDKRQLQQQQSPIISTGGDSWKGNETPPEPPLPLLFCLAGMPEHSIRTHALCVVSPPLSLLEIASPLPPLFFWQARSRDPCISPPSSYSIHHPSSSIGRRGSPPKGGSWGSSALASRERESKGGIEPATLSHPSRHSAYGFRRWGANVHALPKKNQISYESYLNSK